MSVFAARISLEDAKMFLRELPLATSDSLEKQVNDQQVFFESGNFFVRMYIRMWEGFRSKGPRLLDLHCSNIVHVRVYFFKTLRNAKVMRLECPLRTQAIKFLPKITILSQLYRHSRCKTRRFFHSSWLFTPYLGSDAISSFYIGPPCLIPENNKAPHVNVGY